MPLYELTREALTKIPTTTMHERYFREREDLQRLLKEQISAIGEDLFVLSEEFSQWEDSRRRVDLLAVDRDGSLVVIELKRTEDGGHMELQAIRYAAMLSTMRFDQAVNAYAAFKNIDLSHAEATILDFLETAEQPATFGQNIRIILVSPDFSRELTTAVFWLNDNGLDIRCIRLQPYQLGERTLLDIEQIIPVREAQEYTVRLKEKQEEAKQAAASSSDFTRYDLTVDGETFPNLWKRALFRHVIAAAAKAGLPLEKLTGIIPSRKLFIVEGQLRGEEFHAAAEAARKSSGYVFRPERFFMEDEQLINFGNKTVAVSKMWGLPSLPLVDKIIAAVPSADISYRRREETD